MAYTSPTHRDTESRMVAAHEEVAKGYRTNVSPNIYIQHGKLLKGSALTVGRLKTPSGRDIQFLLQMSISTPDYLLDIARPRQ